MELHSWFGNHKISTHYFLSIFTSRFILAIYYYYITDLGTFSAVFQLGIKFYMKNYNTLFEMSSKIRVPSQSTRQIGLAVFFTLTTVLTKKLLCTISNSYKNPLKENLKREASFVSVKVQMPYKT